MRRPRSSPYRIFICSTAPTWWRTAAASACAVRRRRGLLLGQKDLVRAAWINSAPHHAFGRSLKVGKEEIMGMLAAVEMWVKRDHDAEWKQWQSWLDNIAAQATQVPGVSSEILQPEDLSNHAPRLRLHWDTRALGITGTEVEEILLPRAAAHRGRMGRAARAGTIGPVLSPSCPT